MDTIKTGNFISEIRKEKGLTQLELAEKLFVSDKAISRWETGKGFPDIDNLENLSNVLDVSISELLKGERINTITNEELNSITNDSFSLVKEENRKKRYFNILFGFLLGAFAITLLWIHLNSPILIQDANKAIKIETLNDGTLVGILDKDIAGYDVSSFKVDNETYVSINCYQTKLQQLLKKQHKQIIPLGNANEVDYIYYYPGGASSGDTLIYSKDSQLPGGGMLSLPRLVYNYWLLIAIVLSIIGLFIYFIFRKKYYSKLILKIVLIPISIGISIILVLFNHVDEVYNAPYYLSGILLLCVIIYFILLQVISRFNKAAKNA